MSVKYQILSLDYQEIVNRAGETVVVLRFGTELGLKIVYTLLLYNADY